MPQTVQHNTDDNPSDESASTNNRPEWMNLIQPHMDIDESHKKNFNRTMEVL